MSSQRLISLDILRGLTVMLMIFVNNGAGEQIFSTLRHSKWNGMTPCDLVFPFFLFMMGISTYLSLRKNNFAWSPQIGLKIAGRTAMLFLIGLLVNWFDMACSGRPYDLAHLRIMGVMQRIALCYGTTALLAVGLTAVFRSFRPLPWLILLILVLYSALILMGGGYNYNASTNIIASADLRLLGYDHLYHKSPVDPEGLLSTVSAVAHTLTGFWMASWALGSKDEKPMLSTLEKFLIAGAVLVFAGYLLSFAMPLNKRIWSPSYVLMTCGLASLAQGLLICFVDILPESRPRVGFDDTQGRSVAAGKGRAWALIFGTNPLFLYLASEFLGIVFGATGIKDSLYEAIRTVIANGYWAGAAYAALFVLLHAGIGYPLWKRNIYIKI